MGIETIAEMAIITCKIGGVFCLSLAIAGVYNCVMDKYKKNRIKIK